MTPRQIAARLSVSVVIPAINEAKHITAAVNSAFAAGAKEVIVGDGGSSDTTIDLAEQAGATVVHSRPGRAAQQNVAATAATGDYLVFLHADSRLPETAIEQLRLACKDKPPRCGAFRQRIDSPGWKFRLLEAGNAARVRWLGVAYGDQSIFVERLLFDRVGRFPDVPLMEDVLLLRSLRKHAWPTLLGGPILISARRWLQCGVVRQTLRNFCLITALKLGASPDRLAGFYSRHDQADGRSRPKQRDERSKTDE